MPDVMPVAPTESPSHTKASRSRELVIAGVLVSCAPLILLVFNRDWFFTPDGFLDPWHYIGFFREYLNPDYSPGEYKLGRLPWILSGFLFHRMFTPVWAAYALHGLFFGVTTLALFAALYLLLGRLSLAAVVATLFGFYTHAHGSGGFDYHNTGAGAFYLLAVALLAWSPVVAGRRLALIAAGVMIALAVHSNIMLVNLLPALALVHFTSVWVHAGKWPGVGDLLARGGWLLVGAVLITVVLGFVNWMAGREFLFFRSLVDMVARFLGDPERYQATSLVPWSSGWAWTARYLPLPAAVFMAGVVTLMLRRRRMPSTPADRAAAALVAQCVITVPLFIAWQIAGQTALDWDLMAYPLTPVCFIALAGLLVTGWPETWERHWLAAIITTAAVSAIYLVVLDPFVRPLRMLAAPIISVVGALLFAAILLTYLSRPGRAMTVAFVVMFGLGNSFIANGPMGYSIYDRCKTQPHVYAAIVEGGSWLGAVDPTHRRIRTWFDEGEQVKTATGCTVGIGTVGRSITAMAFVPNLARSFPVPGISEIPDEAIRTLAADDQALLAVIVGRPDMLEKWNRRLDALGLAHEDVAAHTVPLLGSSFAIHAWRIAQRPPANLAFGASIVAITRDTPSAINAYGTPKGRIVTDGDRMMFHPTDARDHVSYPFVQLPPRTGESWARVVIDAPVINAPTCRVIVQDQDFTTLGRLGCSSATLYVRVPPSTRGVRVNLADTTGRSFVLPRTIDVALAVSAP